MPLPTPAVPAETNSLPHSLIFIVPMLYIAALPLLCYDVTGVGTVFVDRYSVNQAFDELLI